MYVIQWASVLLRNNAIILKENVVKEVNNWIEIIHSVKQ